MADPFLADPSRASIAGGAIAIDETFWRDRAMPVLAHLARAAIGITATIAGHATDPAQTIGAANGTVIANMLATESGIATDIASVRRGSAFVDRAAAAVSARNAAIAGGSGPTAALTFVAAKIADRSWAKMVDRAAEVLAIAMTDATGTSATFGIPALRRIEMRMATMIAADLASRGHGRIGGDIAATVSRGADAGADFVPAAGFGGRIETATTRIDERFDADRRL